MENKDFGDWLRDILVEQGITQAELARKSGVSDAHISRIISGYPPGKDACQKFAEALKMPREVIFRAAGLLLPRPELEFEEWHYILSQLSERDRNDLLFLARARLEKADQELNQFLDAYEQIPLAERSKYLREAREIIESGLKEMGAKRAK